MGSAFSSIPVLPRSRFSSCSCASLLPLSPEPPIQVVISPFQRLLKGEPGGQRLFAQGGLPRLLAPLAPPKRPGAVVLLQKVQFASRPQGTGVGLTFAQG